MHKSFVLFVVYLSTHRTPSGAAGALCMPGDPRLGSSIPVRLPAPDNMHAWRTQTCIIASKIRFLILPQSLVSYSATLGGVWSCDLQLRWWWTGLLATCSGSSARERVLAIGCDNAGTSICHGCKCTEPADSGIYAGQAGGTTQACSTAHHQ
jgi:hypothetical protein